MTKEEFPNRGDAFRHRSRRFIVVWLLGALFPIIATRVARADLLARHIDQSQYFICHQRDEWIYNVISTVGDGPPRKKTQRCQIGAEIQVNGKRYFRRMTDGQCTSLVRRDSTGVYSLEQPAKPEPDEQRIIAEERIASFPLKIGNTWLGNKYAPPVTMTLLGVETVRINAALYRKCIRIERRQANMPNMVEEEWEAPAVGMIKRVVRYSGGGKITLTLKQYKPGK